MKRVFEASDGTQFTTAAACKDYEETTWIRNLEGLTDEAIARGLNRIDLKIADALERAGSAVAAKRRRGGEFKRAQRNIRK